MPVLADVDPDTFTLDPRPVERGASAARTRAIVPVHLYGQCADLAPHRRARAAAAVSRSSRTARRRTARSYDGRRAGTFGDAAAFSFYPTKNLGALGDGGAVVTDDPTSPRARACCATTASGAQVRARAPGQEQPARRAPGARCSRKLAAPRRVERAAPRARRALSIVTRELEGNFAPPEAEGRLHVYHLYVVVSTTT